uniref:Putative ovule protein n=1 Tax=Solanum chacoense TaxID=4108 RepID=A0A0V0HQR4_SOLCH
MPMELVVDANGLRCSYCSILCGSLSDYDQMWLAPEDRGPLLQNKMTHIKQLFKTMVRHPFFH